MDVLILAAGTSSRMGKTNKLLPPVGDTCMVTNTCMQAISFLETQKDPCRLVVVTGYRHASILKALQPCIDRLGRTQGPVSMVVVQNTNYRDGQFSSTKTGLLEIQDNVPFFIQLSDLPLIQSKHYAALAGLLGTHKAVRPFYHENPGHPVLFAPEMKHIILGYDNTFSVGKILKGMDVLAAQMDDPAYITDVDTPSDLPVLTSQPPLL